MESEEKEGSDLAAELEEDSKRRKYDRQEDVYAVGGALISHFFEGYLILLATTKYSKKKKEERRYYYMREMGNGIDGTGQRRFIAEEGTWQAGNGAMLPHLASLAALLFARWPAAMDYAAFEKKMDVGTCGIIRRPTGGEIVGVGEYFREKWQFKWSKQCLAINYCANKLFHFLAFWGG